MFTDMHFDIQVAWYSTFENLTLACETHHLAVVDTGRYVYRNFFLFYKFRIYDHLPLCTENRFLEREFDVHRNITATSDATSTENRGENIAKIPCVETCVAEAREVEAKPRWVKPATSAIGGSASGGKCVILCPFFLVREYSISLTRLFKLRLITTRLVWMVNMRQFTEGLFYLIFRSIPIYSKYLIVVFHSEIYPISRLACFRIFASTFLSSSPIL